jgi:hypothetical protein
MIDPAEVCLYIPPGLKKFKLKLFEGIGARIVALGGRVVRHDPVLLEATVRDGAVPIVGCMPDVTHLIEQWRRDGRRWIYWDRGYARRVFATCLPRGDDGGYYRWHLGAFQLRTIKKGLSDDRWRALRTEVRPWSRGGGHVVIAAPTRTYCRFHRCPDWIADTIDALARVTDRQLVIRDKEQYERRPIQRDLAGAHCLVTHASNAAVEAVILGCPVFVHTDSAAALVGQTDLARIESPVYPDREDWLRSLAYSQFNESELVNGTLWRLMT